jgi:hypothetical protein
MAYRPTVCASSALAAPAAPTRARFTYGTGLALRSATARGLPALRRSARRAPSAVVVRAAAAEVRTALVGAPILRAFPNTSAG